MLEASSSRTHVTQRQREQIYHSDLYVYSGQFDCLSYDGGLGVEGGDDGLEGVGWSGRYLRRCGLGRGRISGGPGRFRAPG